MFRRFKHVSVLWLCLDQAIIGLNIYLSVNEKIFINVHCGFSTVSAAAVVVNILQPENETKVCKSKNRICNTVDVYFPNTLNGINCLAGHVLQIYR